MDINQRTYKINCVNTSYLCSLQNQIRFMIRPLISLKDRVKKTLPTFNVLLTCMYTIKKQKKAE